MAFSQKLFTSLQNYNNPDTKIGELNRIWYDSINNVFRIQLDKTTPGGTIIGGSSTNLSGYATLTTTQTLTNKTLTSPNITNGVFQDTFTIGNQIFYEHGYNGFSVNEDFDIVGENNFTGYHYTSGYGREGVAFTLARTGQFTTGFGIHGTASNNEYVIGSETTNTDFVFKNNIGMPFNVSGGTEIFRISKTGVLTTGSGESLETIATETFVTTRGYLTSVGTISYTDLSNKPTIPTTVTVNGTSITLGSSGTVTADANTLTGTTLKSTVVTSSLTTVGTLGSLTVTYTPGTAIGSAITATGKDTQGGTGYFDFFKATNTNSGATNPNKTFRLNSTGAIEIINSAYTATLMSLNDTGFMSVKGAYQVGGKQAVNGPAFRAFVAVGQTITSGSQQKVTFGGETFDTDNCFGDSTYTFTPTLEGYYQFNATIRISGTAGTGEVMLVLYKNGSEYSRGTNESGTEQGASFYSMMVSDIAYANGTTDYFDVRIQQTSGADRTTTAGSAISHFSGCMIRGA